MAKSKQAIQTNLLGTEVRIGMDDVAGIKYGPTTETANKEGIIRNVYYDNYGDLMYTIQVKISGNLIELYPCHFRILRSELSSSYHGDERD